VVAFPAVQSYSLRPRLAKISVALCSNNVFASTSLCKYCTCISPRRTPPPSSRKNDQVLPLAYVNCCYTVDSLGTACTLSWIAATMGWSRPRYDVKDSESRFFGAVCTIYFCWDIALLPDAVRSYSTCACSGDILMSGTFINDRALLPT
jgi:hypothetical protein